MQLTEIVPWGRGLPEYIQMFSLPSTILKSKILDCAGGPSGFNSTITKLGGNVVSCDVVYNQTKEELNEKIQGLYSQIKTEIARLKSIHPPEAVKAFEDLNIMRMAAMKEFLEDYDTGKKIGRYLHAGLPSLPFKDKEFNLALCSHFLFTYTDQLSLDFHIESIKELARVGEVVKIFPLFNIDGTPSSYLNPVIGKLLEEGYKVDLETVHYLVQEGANQMMVVST